MNQRALGFSNQIELYLDFVQIPHTLFLFMILKVSFLVIAWVLSLSKESLKKNYVPYLFTFHIPI